MFGLLAREQLWGCAVVDDPRNGLESGSGAVVDEVSRGRRRIARTETPTRVIPGKAFEVALASVDHCRALLDVFWWWIFIHSLEKKSWP